GYYNPILAYERDKAVLDAHAAGANRYIIVSLSPEEASGLCKKCMNTGLSYVPLIVLSMSLHRLPYLTSIVNSFIYIVSHVSFSFV
ncbi:hypothetical protein EDD17DRAFT_1486926, partial [Pisolithus thermaeus]